MASFLHTFGLLLLGLILAAPNVFALVEIPMKAVGTAPPLPVGPPQPAPSYARNNINNAEGAAPDKGVLEGPVLGPLNSSILEDIHRNADFDTIDSDAQSSSVNAERGLQERQAGSFWLGSLGSAGKSPLAPSGYQFFRNVQAFGAVGDGIADDTAAINRAAAAYSQTNLGQLRCGLDCGSTTTLTAVVYFPPGTYRISSPIIQYYHTQFVGDANSKPVIKGTANFTGIALFDNNFYVPGGDSRQWYINQSNFLRQIRNFVFDMRGMARFNYQGDQEYVPTGIHWQVGQATSITNCDFIMDVSTEEGGATAMGIMMENGSGGVVSDLTFTGGNIGFFAGSQQFTATNLKFTSCLTAIKQVWNWGFTWKNIYVLSCWVAIDATMYSTVTKQGTGSITVLDSHFNGVPYAITLGQLASQQPNVVLDNLLVENSESVVLVSGGATILPGSASALTFNSWVSGYQSLPSGSSGKRSGFSKPAVVKPSGLLDSSGRYFWRPKPQYESTGAGSIIVATTRGISNDGTGDQTTAINNLLSSSRGSVIFFPAGIYLVRGTVFVPVGSKIVGSGWSQIMGTGTYFQDENNPKVMVRVGNEGDSGLIEISDMMFTVKGPTAGCILMEWNVHEGAQGSAAMWDSHFRVGGATGTDLQLEDCAAPASTVLDKCKAGYMLMHVTRESSGYFDNIWLWVSDHDLDNDLNAEAYQSPEGIPLNVLTQISIYVGRGLLIESQGPTWLYGTSSEHCQLYQYGLVGASNIFLSHMQTETPYYQPNPNALEPYDTGSFVGDPTFQDCADSSCRGAWALRVVNSTDIIIYSAGFYSFFKNNGLGCTATESCQLALVETSYTERLWLYNLFTKGNVQIVSPKGGLLPLLFNDTTRNGYTSEIAAWLPLALDGGDMGISPNSSDGSGSGDVYIDPGIWRGGSSLTLTCFPPCTYILPPSTLRTPTTIRFPLTTTSLEVGWFTGTHYTGFDGLTTTTTEYVSVVVTTTLTIPSLTTSLIHFSNVPVPPGVNSTIIYPETSLNPPPFVITDDPDPEDNGATHPPNTRTITPKPWPPSTVTDTTLFSPSLTHTRGPPGPICTGSCGRKCRVFCDWPCPDECDGGSDCSGVDCDHGGDCSGPDCEEGGTCKGPRCKRGGNCHGPKCKRGGGCEGPFCDSGGDCFGLLCLGGGPCIGPLCRTGGDCGPLPCSKGGCTGPYCGRDEITDDYYDSNDPNGPDPDDPDECTTRTTSSCRSLCVTTPTSSCSSTCSQVLGCDPTGPTWASTVTPAPAHVMPGWEEWDDQAAPFPKHTSVARDVYSYLVDIGDFSGITGGNPPTLTSSAPPYSGPECSKYTTTTVCNGSGGQAACLTQRLCVPTLPCPPTYGATGTPVCSGASATCLVTTIQTRCARGAEPTHLALVEEASTEEAPQEPTVVARHEPAPTSSASATSEALSPRVDLPSEPNLPAVPIQSQDITPEDVTINPAAVDVLFPRQNGCGGSANGGCDYIRFCALCATVTRVPCLIVDVFAVTGPLSGTDLTTVVIEDGVEVCRSTMNCENWDEDCNGRSNYNCGGGNSVGWAWNYVQYKSAKYSATFPLYLDLYGPTEIDFCWQGIFPSLCAFDLFTYQGGPCASVAGVEDTELRGWDRHSFFSGNGSSSRSLLLD